MMKTRMKRVVNIAGPILIAVALVVGFNFLVAGKHIAVLQPSGEVAGHQRNILLFTALLSSLVVIPVFTMLIFFAVKYRAGNKTAKYTPEWGENKVLEGLWWGIPIFIIGILGVVTYQTSHSLDPYKQLSGGAPLEVQVVALQWKWLFIYPDQHVATLNQLPIPVDRPVHFTMTADAPMSAFWIPALGSQVYAMTGMSSELNLKALKVGEFTGYTTNINGAGYAKMTFATKVLPQSEFIDWSTRASKASNTMDMTEYERLAKPKSETDQRMYTVTDPGLFDSIQSKYGHNQHKEHSL